MGTQASTEEGASGCSAQGSSEWQSGRLVTLCLTAGQHLGCPQQGVAVTLVSKVQPRHQGAARERGEGRGAPPGASVGMGIPQTSVCHSVDLAGVEEDTSESSMFTARSWGKTPPFPAQTGVGASRPR